MLNKKKENQPLTIFDYIKENISIIDVINKLNLHFTEQGDRLVGNCPSGHTSESETCCTIYPESNSYYCYNCEDGGSIIDFLLLSENFTTKETIDWFAEHFELEIPDFYSRSYTSVETSEEKLKRKEIRNKSLLYEELVKYGKEKLYNEEGKEALNYLVEERGYSVENLKNTDFFYLPLTSDSKAYLEKELPHLEGTINNLHLNGYYGDNFRLAFPYRNKRGQITGLVKRATRKEGFDIQTFDGKEHNKVRWDSSKGVCKDDLFGIHRIRGEKTLLVVEGYPEAIYFPALGFENIVAAGQGTLGKKQINALKLKNIENVILCLDNDNSGSKNTPKAISLLAENSEINIFVLEPSLLAPHKDPDEFVKANGMEAFKSVLDKAVSSEKWMAQQLLEGFKEFGDLKKSEMLNDAICYYNKLKDPLIEEQFLKSVIELTGYNKTELSKKLKKEKEKYVKDLMQRNNYDFSHLLNNKLIPFIERKTSTYSYYDSENDELYLGQSKDLLENILLSEGYRMPEIFPVLKADFNPHKTEKIDFESKSFNLYTPSEFLLYIKNEEQISLETDCKNIDLLIRNLINDNSERKHFYNWLAGCAQTKEKQMTSWVFKTAPGAGKNLLLKTVLKPIFGKRQAIQVEDQQLKSDFNPWLMNVLFIGFNEVAHDNNSRNNVNSKIKAIITDEELMINEKNVKNFLINNYVNCVFFSNESIPVLIEDNDRRFNVVVSNEKLSDKEWFQNSDEFIQKISEELPKFAQYLMNYNYDKNKAKTVLNSVAKEAIVSISRNRYEEFAYRLKTEDTEWFLENQNTDNSFKFDLIELNDKQLNGKIEKDLAVRLFNKIYADKKITKTALTKQLAVYGVIADRIRTKDVEGQYYLWQLP